MRPILSALFLEKYYLKQTLSTSFTRVLQFLFLFELLMWKQKDINSYHNKQGYGTFCTLLDNLLSAYECFWMEKMILLKCFLTARSTEVCGGFVVYGWKT